MPNSLTATDPPISEDLALAQRVARVGGAAALAQFKCGLTSTAKAGPADVVTDADLAAQSAMIDLLLHERPSDGVLAEEGPIDIPGVRRWVLDPIDGTLAYERGLPLWSVAVALVDPGGWRLSAVFDPVAHEMFTAHRDGDAMLDGRTIRTATTSALSQAVVHTWLDPPSSASTGFIDLFRHLVTQSVAIKAGGSGSQAMAWVAAGRLDAFVEVYPHGESQWDWLPASHVVERAGGSTLRVANWRIAASTPELVDDIRTLIPSEMM